MEFVVLLATPIAGALLLAVWGDRRWAAEINIGLSFGTFLAAAALTIRVIGEGNLVAWREQFFLDPFNVFLVALTAFVGLTTAIFSRPYMQPRAARCDTSAWTWAASPRLASTSSTPAASR